MAGCGAVQPPPGGTPVPFTVLTMHSGLLPLDGGGSNTVLAAKTIDNLVVEETGSLDRAPGPCTRAGPSFCLPRLAVPPGSLLVGITPVACADNHLDTAYLEHGTLIFAMTWSNTCPPGAGTAAVPEDWVVAVPLNALPRTRLPIELDYFNGGQLAPAGTGLVDLRLPGPGRALAGNFSLDAAPVVARGKAELVSLTIYGLFMLRVYPRWLPDIALHDHEGRIAWHQVAFDSPQLQCLVGTRDRCFVGAYQVQVPTGALAPGRYEIRPTFTYGAGNIVLPQPPPQLPPFALPSLTFDVTA